MTLIYQEAIYNLAVADTFCQRGARNSFSVNPISPYVIGETQKPHLNHHGNEAEMNKFHGNHFFNNFKGI